MGSSTYRIICIGENAGDCVSGHLTLTSLFFRSAPALKVGVKQRVKGRDWRCTWVGRNGSGEPLAEFRPLDKHPESGAGEG